MAHPTAARRLARFVVGLALEAKFRGNAALALSSERAERVIRSVYRLSAGEPLADLLASLTPERTRP